MVRYNKNIKDKNKYLRELTWFSCKRIIILALIGFVFSTFFLLVGILDDREALSYGIGLFGLTMVLLLIVIRMIFYYKKNLDYFFKNADGGGNINCILEKENDQYVFVNITNKTIDRIDIKDIKSIVRKKNIIFIILKVGKTMFIPNTEELIELFGNEKK